MFQIITNHIKTKKITNWTKQNKRVSNDKDNVNVNDNVNECVYVNDNESVHVNANSCCDTLALYI